MPFARNRLSLSDGQPRENEMEALQYEQYFNIIDPLLSDDYQYNVAYSYFLQGRHEERGVFEMFFRANPFKGEYTVFAGLSDVVKFLRNFKITDKQIIQLKYTPSQPFRRWTRAPAGDRGIVTGPFWRRCKPPSRRPDPT